MSGRAGKVLERRFIRAEISDVDRANCKEPRSYPFSNCNLFSEIGRARKATITIPLSTLELVSRQLWLLTKKHINTEIPYYTREKS
jgi:hypothetical protein